MKKLAISAIIAAGIAAPAFAQSQLEKSLGVEAGRFTLGQLVLMKDMSEEEGIEGRVFLGNGPGNVVARNVHGNVATQIFDDLAATPEYRGNSTVNFSARNKHNSVARQIFRGLASTPDYFGNSS